MARIHFGCTTHVCAREMVWVRNPVAPALGGPHGPAVKLAIHCLDGTPVSADLRLASGEITILPLDWITDPPAHVDNVIPGPWPARKEIP